MSCVVNNTKCFLFLRVELKFQVTAIGITVCNNKKRDPPFQTNKNFKGRN